MKRALVALAPGLVVAVIVTAFYVAIPERIDWLVGMYGAVVYVGGLVLAWIFHRSRAFMVLALVGWLDVFVVGGQKASRLHDLLGALVIDGADSSVIVVLGSAVLGLVGLVALLRDRGVASRVGLLQLLATGALAGAAAILATDPGRMAELAGDPQLESLTRMTALGLPRLTVFTALFTAATVAYGLQRYRGPIERGLMWTSIFLLVAMHPGIATEHASLFLMGAGLTLTFSVIETSYVMAYRDELTGLPGRRALMQYLDGIHGTYTLAMVDVDHFKRFNDKHGHDVGDQVLKLVASRLAKAPGGAKAYRYGGEEFTVLLPGRVKHEARPYLESVRASVEKARFTLRSWRRPRRKPSGGRKRRTSRKDRSLSVTVSIGMADTADDGDKPREILKKADEALYRAKKRGRNRVAE